ncbi:hypothetical protein QBC35DRAFT_456000 [Podospora australis]|uniref:Fungal N-terminal domain-containing protein n=1 Tax=Podospora australis TaxID=1536484 RepID=A0AAN6WP15_9PEZI|nr:hypothetical protein QBC35DRAFT_456000 [Podospora australis]
MAEIIGVVGSAISIAAFAGQLAKASISFVKIFQEGPAEIDPQPDPVWELALRHCQTTINDLSKKLADLGAAHITTTQGAPAHTPKRQKVHKQFTISLKLSDLAKHANALEHAKSMLTQCCMNRLWVSQTGISNAVAGVAAAVPTIASSQANMSTALDGIATSVSNVANQQSSIANSVTHATNALVDLHKPISRIEMATSATQNNVEGLAQDIAEIKEMYFKTYTIMSSLETTSFDMRQRLQETTAISQDIATNIQDLGTERLKREFTDDIQEAISNGLGEWRQQPEYRALTPGRLDRFCVGIAEAHPARPPFRYEPTQNNPPSTWVKRSSTVSWEKTVRAKAFGTVVARTVTASYTRQRFTHSTEGEIMETKEQHETSITFYPVGWLS